MFLFTGDLNKMTRSGVVFCTYSLLIQGGGRVADLGKDGVDLNALLMKPGSRLEQLVSWLGEDKHGPLVVFDECHRAKNLVNENGTFICISVRAISMTSVFCVQACPRKPRSPWSPSSAPYQTQGEFLLIRLSYGQLD